MENCFKDVSISDYVVEKIESAGITVDKFVKFAKIIARKGFEGEEVVTTMANGLEETRNVVKLDCKTGQPDWIVTNPGGEEYIVSDSTFQKKYELDLENPKQYKPKGGAVIAVKTTENIEFLAPWGETMKIEAGGFIIVNGPTDIYGIQKQEFLATYMTTGECKLKNLEELKQLIHYEFLIKNIEKRRKVKEYNGDIWLFDDTKSSIS